jgi:hypothetical protein
MMELSFLTLTVLVLAASQVVDTWLHGEIFAVFRSHVESWDNRLSDLMGCPMCLSHHTPYLLVGLVWSATWLGSFPGMAATCIVVSLAATRAMLVIDGLLPEHMRHDRDSVELNELPGGFDGRRSSGGRDDPAE